MPPGLGAWPVARKESGIMRMTHQLLGGVLVAAAMAGCVAVSPPAPYGATPKAVVEAK